MESINAQTCTFNIFYCLLISRYFALAVCGASQESSRLLRTHHTVDEVIKRRTAVNISCLQKKSFTQQMKVMLSSCLFAHILQDRLQSVSLMCLLTLVFLCEFWTVYKSKANFHFQSTCKHICHWYGQQITVDHLQLSHSAAAAMPSFPRFTHCRCHKAEQETERVTHYLFKDKCSVWGFESYLLYLHSFHSLLIKSTAAVSWSSRAVRLQTCC